MERKSRKMSDAQKEKIRKALKDYWAKIPYEPEQENNITNTKTEQ